MSANTKLKIHDALRFSSVFGYFCRKKAPSVAKRIWDSARKTMTSGYAPEIKKPYEDPRTTKMAIHGLINIAIKIATWLPSVYEAGGITNFSGIAIGMKMAIAVNSAVSVIKRTFFIRIKLSFLTVYTVV